LYARLASLQFVDAPGAPAGLAGAYAPA
jgi:hypothetical protein